MQKIKVERLKTNNPYLKVLNIIDMYLKGNTMQVNGIKSKEAYFFINSVSAISKIIDKAGLKQSQVKIVCADNYENKKTLKGFEINNVSDDNRMFTFITRASFEGCDFYSETGISFVVSDNKNKNTLLDIATDIMQIAGRIRNIDNPFKYCLYHIYNNTSIEITKEEFDVVMNDRIDKAKATISACSKLDNIEKSTIIDKIEFSNKHHNEDELTRVDNNVIIIDDLKIKSLYYQFNIVNEIYNNGLNIRNAYLENGFNVTTQDYQQLQNDFINRIDNISNFRDNLKEYIQLKESGNYFENMFRIQQIEDSFPIVIQAYKLLGKDKIKALGYDRNRIVQAVSDNRPNTKNAVLYNLKKMLKVGNRYSKADIKDMLTNIYTKLNIAQKAKATDIKEYYDVKDCKIDRTIMAFEIINLK